MKKIIIFILFCVLPINAQKMISVDSVLILIKNKHVFEVSDRLYIGTKDKETLYNNPEFKKFILSGLDQNAYFEYCMKRQDDEFKELMKKEDFSKDRLKSYLNGVKKGKTFDSIITIPQLFEKYKDTIIEMRSMLNRKGKNIEQYYPSVNMFIYFPYPEAHKMIKEWWLREPDYSAVTINWTKVHFFDTLLFMNDPDAQQLFTEKIDEFVKTNGKSSSFPEISGKLNSLNNSFSVKIVFKVLGIKGNYVRMSHGDKGSPFNCEVLDDLVSFMSYKGIDVLKNPLSLKDVYNENDEMTNCNFQMKNLSKIKESSEKLIIKLDKEQEYWMKNMPFYKKKD
jgi:hypothetical protein